MLLGSLMAWPGAAGAEGPVRRDAFVQALLDRSRLLEDVHFGVPVAVYRQFLRDRAGAGPEPAAAPVPWIAESGTYQLTLAADNAATLTVEVALYAFDPRRSRALPLLSEKWIWREVTVNGKPAELPVRKGWLRFSPPAAGRYAVSAKAVAEPAANDTRAVGIDVPPTVRTLVRFDSPGAWRVEVAGVPGGVTGQAAAGTHGELALTPTRRIDLTYARPLALPPRPPRYELRGAVAWNLDAGRQQVDADLDVRILGGQTDRLDLALPASATRVSITGPDVREARVSGGAAAVFLRGRIVGQTRLRVEYELPLAAGGGVQRLGRIDVQGGHWVGGTLVVTNTAGGSEVLPHSVEGLREAHPADLPERARAILLGKPVLAYEIASRSYEAAIDVIHLGEFALRESIADLAHYQVLFRGDGSTLCKARYELRNRNRQFLRVTLPAGAIALAARVNDMPRPLAPVAGERGVYLLPLVRSQASVKGLVSFPVELLVLFRGGGLRRGEGEALLRLPRIDLPIAYGWCELHVPDGMKVRQWAGPMEQVQRYSSETAVASLTYGRGELAEGYRPEDRPTTETRARVEPKPVTVPAPAEEPPDDATKAAPSPRATTQPAAPAKPAPVQQPVPELPTQVLLARNYYRAGRDSYDRGRYDEAAESLRKAKELAPKGPDAPNAERLLSNIRVVRGTVEATGRQERALGRQVKQEVAGFNVRLADKQRRLLEEGREAVQAGRLDKAATQFRAAQSLGEQLVKQGADEKEQTIVLREAEEHLEKLHQRQTKQAEVLQEKYKTLKGKGDYSAALAVGKQLQRLDGGRGEKIREELEDLAVKEVRLRSQTETVAGFVQPQDLVAKTPTVLLPIVPQGESRFARRSGGEGRPVPDTADKDEESGVQVVRLRNADASEVAKALEQVQSGSGRGGRWADARPEARRIVVDTLSNALVLRAPEGKREELLETVRQLDSAARSGEAPQRDGGFVSEMDRVFGPSDASRPAREGGAPAEHWYEYIRYPKDGKQLSEERWKRRDPASAPPGGVVSWSYDVRDLVYGNQAAPQTGGGKSGAESPDKTDGLAGTIRATLGGGTGGGGGGAGTVSFTNGRLIVRGTAEQQKAAGELLGRLRDIRGPQVQLGGNIARQRAGGLVELNGDVGGNGTLDDFQFDFDGPAPDAGRPRGGSAGADRQREVAHSLAFQDFISRNYNWQAGRAGQAPTTPMLGTVPVAGGLFHGGTGAAEKLSGKLLGNLEQKVAVNSLNVNVDAASAGQLGIDFVEGTHDVRYAVVDEAQLRTLRDVEARRGTAAAGVQTGPRFQETIVGTDALLAGGQVANVAFAADTGNTLAISGNTIALPHEKYVLLDNNGYLTAVRAGEMQHWTEPVKPLEFAEVPQEIDVPRVGRLEKFEKTLIKPTDELTIRATYTWKGAEQ